MRKRRKLVLYLVGAVLIIGAGVGGPPLVRYIEERPVRREIARARAEFETAAAGIPAAEFVEPVDSLPLATLLAEVEFLRETHDVQRELMQERAEIDADGRRKLDTYFPEARKCLERLDAILENTPPIPLARASGVTTMLREIVELDQTAAPETLARCIALTEAVLRKTSAGGVMRQLPDVLRATVTAGLLRTLAARGRPPHSLLRVLRSVEPAPETGPPARGLLEELTWFAKEHARDISGRPLKERAQRYRQATEHIGRLRAALAHADASPEDAAAFAELDKAFVGGHLVFAKSVARWRLTHAGLLVLDYRATNGSWPASLAECGAADLVDPFARGPFVLERTASGLVLRCTRPGVPTHRLLDDDLAWKLPTPPSR